MRKNRISTTSEREKEEANSSGQFGQGKRKSSNKPPSGQERIGGEERQRLLQRGMKMCGRGNPWRQGMHQRKWFVWEGNKIRRGGKVSLKEEGRKLISVRKEAPEEKYSEMRET